MVKRQKTETRLRVIEGGKSDVRSAYEACRADGTRAFDVPVITVRSRDDEAYAAEIARLVWRT